MIVLFGIFVRFNPEANVADWEKEKQQRNVSDIENEFYFRYPCEYNYTRKQVVFFFGMPFVFHFSSAKILNQKNHT